MVRHYLYDGKDALLESLLDKHHHSAEGEVRLMVGIMYDAFEVGDFDYFQGSMFREHCKVLRVWADDMMLIMSHMIGIIERDEEWNV